MPVAKSSTKLYRALVNLSVGSVTRTAGGREEKADLFERGTTRELTDEQASTFGRLVRLVEDEKSPDVGRNPRPSAVIGVSNVNKLGQPAPVQGGALDVADKTTVYKSEAEKDEEAQPTNNEVDPSYKGDDK